LGACCLESFQDIGSVPYTSTMNIVLLRCRTDCILCSIRRKTSICPYISVCLDMSPVETLKACVNIWWQLHENMLTESNEHYLHKILILLNSTTSVSQKGDLTTSPSCWATYLCAIQRNMHLNDYSDSLSSLHHSYTGHCPWPEEYLIYATFRSCFYSHL
jgi:hypothetical protein